MDKHLIRELWQIAIQSDNQSARVIALKALDKAEVDIGAFLAEEASLDATEAAETPEITLDEAIKLANQ